MSYETRYAAAMQARADRLASTPQAQEERRLLKLALDSAREDVSAAFPVVTVENATEAFAFQQQRIALRRQEFGV